VTPEPVFWPTFVTHTGTDLAVSCVLVTELHPSANAYTAMLATAQALWSQLGDLPRCGAGPLQSTVDSWWTATVVAALPPPHVRIEPSVGIVGLANTATVSATTSAQFTRSTPDGSLQIRTTGTLALVVGGHDLPVEPGSTALVPDAPGVLVVQPSES